MIRGGSWNADASNCRSAIRNRIRPDDRNNNLGFRLASQLPLAAEAPDGTDHFPVRWELFPSAKSESESPGAGSNARTLRGMFSANGT